MSSLEFSPISVRPQGRTPYHVAIIGAGPTGLAMACELASAGLSVVVLEARSAPSAGDRPQLLVARPGDLANLHRLGVDISDPTLVSPIATRCTENRIAGTFSFETVEQDDYVPPAALSVMELAEQKPVALVPISLLQRALVDIAIERGATVHFETRVNRVRRHTRAASIEIDGGPPLLAHMVIIATGAGRSLANEYGVFRSEKLSDTQFLIGGVFDSGAPSGRWHRFEMALRGAHGTLRCTMLQTSTESSAGTALLLSAPDAKPSLLRNYFWGVADTRGLGRSMVAHPQVFETGVAASEHRFLARDNRAPIVLVGDAAQTGHVFAGLTCFANLWAAIELADRLIGRALEAICDARNSDRRLFDALVDYELLSDQVTTVFAQAAEPHLAKRRSVSRAA